MKTAIVQVADTGPLESLVVMLQSAGYESYLPSDEIKSKLRGIGCDTVLDVGSLTENWGYDRPMNLPEARLGMMKHADLFVDVKAHRAYDKIVKEWPNLQGRVLWYRIADTRLGSSPKNEQSHSPAASLLFESCRRVTNMPEVVRTYKPIPGFLGYRVGSDGTVWTCWASRGGHYVGGRGIGGMKIGTKWKELNQVRRGGNQAWSVHLSKEGRSIHKFVHQLVLEAFVGPCPEGMVCRHGACGRDNNHVYNLSWGTQKENIADKYRDGTRVFGIVHHNAKLTPEVVKKARQEYAAGFTSVDLAKRYNVSQASMWSALNRRTWKEVV